MTLSSASPRHRLGSDRVHLSTTTPLTGGGLLCARGDVTVPTYDRTPSVVHISVGGFTRAHQLLYFDEIAQRRISDRWGVRGIGLHSRALKDALAPQDYLYLLVEQGAEHERARVVGSLIGYPDHRAAVAAAFGVHDRWPVVTEPFCQWIVQDDFGSARPPLDQVGARFVSDVRPYQLTKTRLVNGGHCALVYLGQLARYTHTHEVLADPVLHDYAARLLNEEVSPLLPLIEGVDLADYTKTVLTRFANPAIGDRLERLCGRGSTKMPSYLLPSLHEAVLANRPHALLALAVAAWCQYLRRVDAAGEPIEIHDDRGPELQGLAIAGGLDPRPLLGERSVFQDLGQHPSVVDAVARALRGFERDGVHATVAAFTNSPFTRTTGAAAGASA